MQCNAYHRNRPLKYIYRLISPERQVMPENSTNVSAGMIGMIKQVRGDCSETEPVSGRSALRNLLRKRQIWVALF